MADHTTISTIAATVRVVTCDRRQSRGRRAGKICGAPATHFDRARRENVCGRHAPDVLGALPGTGVPWYSDPIFGCDTAGHADRALRRIVDGVRMCYTCSGDYALADLRAFKAREAQESAA